MNDGQRTMPHELLETAAHQKHSQKNANNFYNLVKRSTGAKWSEIKGNWSQVESNKREELESSGAK